MPTYKSSIDSNSLVEAKQVSPNFVCERTGKNDLVISALDDYLFTNSDLDEDLYLFEVKLNVSDKAIMEAKLLYNDGNVQIPENYSTDKELESFVRKEIEDSDLDYAGFKKLDAVYAKEWEFDQAVLMALLYLHWVG